MLSKRDLGGIAESYQGAVTGDLQRFVACFWEISASGDVWDPFRTAIESPTTDNGLSCAIRWENGVGELAEYARLTRDQLHDMHESGQRAWGNHGVAINRIRGLNSTLFLGEKFDNNVAVLIPKAPEFLLPILSFCTSNEFVVAVRALDQTLKVTNQTLRKVPFDLTHWQKVAAERYPREFPEPFSSDQTQWLFKGHPNGSDQPLHVAVARLLGYRWPRQTGTSFPDCPVLSPDGLQKHAESDGIVCLTSVAGKASAADRLRSLLADSFGEEWSATKLIELLGATTSLEVWLRDRLFEEHCQIFQQRPFAWHVWDGRNDGFSCRGELPQTQSKDA